MVESFIVASAAWAFAQLVDDVLLCNALLFVAAIPAEWVVLKYNVMMTMCLNVVLV